MCRINVDVDISGMNDILILSYYVVDDQEGEIHLLKIMMINNNITSAVSEKLKHLI